MSSIDERIVKAKFDNADFERGVRSTLTQLDQLKKGMKLEGATKGLDDVSRAANKFSLAGIAQGVDQVASRFSALGIAGVAAITNITNRVVNAGLELAKSFSFSPIMAGLDEYETNLNSIQTVLANTGLSGQKGLDKVNGALQALNTYSDQTIYNFSEMARNIGTFTSAGVKLDTSVAAIKGIANLAAISGSSSEQASTAMYQLSQALASGTVKLMDWNSVVNAGMGGKVFQESLKETARAHGVAVDDIIKKEGSFRDSLQKGWLTSSILTETLNKFTGDLSEKQLKTMGYNEKQIAGIMKMGKTAQDAATKIKTVHQLVDTLQEALGSGWSQTWQLIFGDFGQAKTLFTNVNNTLGGMIQASSRARNKMLADWAKAGGRDALIQAIANSFHALQAVVKPISDAFRQIFPPATGKQLADMSKAIRDFTAGLKIGGDTANKLQRTFAGVFALFHIGLTVVKEAAKMFLGLFGSVGKGAGSFLDTTSSIGDFLVALDKALTKGGALADFFHGLGSILAVPIQLLGKFTSFLGSLFSNIGGMNGGGASSGIAGLISAVGKLMEVGDLAGAAWKALGAVIRPIFDFMVGMGGKVSDAVSKIGDSLSGAFSNIDWGKVLAIINTGLFGGLVLGIRSFMKKIIGAISGGNSGPSIVDTIKEAFGGLTETLKSMQQTLRAATLLEIAGAIGILTLSVVALSKIDSGGLTKALTAMTVMFGQLAGSMLIFQKIGGVKGLSGTALGLILLATALDIMASAVKKLADLDWNGLAKGLTGVTVLIGGLVLAVRGMSGQSQGMITAGVGLVILAGAIKILAGAVTDLSSLSWGDMAKGLTGVATLLAALTLYTKFSEADAGGIAQGAGLVLLATGIKILASAISDFQAISWEGMTKGLVGMAGGLTAMGAALVLIPPSSLLSAAAVLIVAASLGMVSDALAKMGGMDWETIAKGLVTLAGALGIIAGAMYLMTGALPGAAAMLVVAASLQILAPVLQSFGSMDWENIAKAMVVLAGGLTIIAAAMLVMVTALPGAAALLVVAGALAILNPVIQSMGQMPWENIAKSMVVLAGAFTIIGVAGLLLTPLIPTLLGLGVAITLLGVGMLAAGAGVLAFSIGLTALAVAGAAGAAAIVGIVAGLAGTIPVVMKEIGLGIIAFAQVIATAGPALMGAMTTVMLSILGAVARVTPQIISTLFSMLSQFLGTLLRYVPNLVSAGMRLVIGVLNGISQNIGRLVTVATSLVVNFINGISANVGRVIDAGVKLAISFVNGVANSLRNNQAAMNAAGQNLAGAIISGMASGIASGASSVIGAAVGMAKSALSAAAGALGIHSPSREFAALGKYSAEGYAKGLKGSKAQIQAAGKSMQDLISKSMQNAADDIHRLTLKLDKLKSARKKDRVAIRETSRALAQARTEYAKSAAAQKVLKSPTISRDNTKLRADTKKLDSIKPRLDAAQKALADAVKVRDDYNKSVRDQYGNLPDVSNDTQLTDYITELRQKIVDTRQFATAIQKLRDLGLNDEMYKELIAKGPDALPFVQQVLDQGKSGVKDLNTLGSQLAAAAKGLADSASKSLYQAAVDSAAGLVKGLQNQEKAIQAQMNKIADAMVKAIKKALGIKSPSREFMEVGSYSLQGLAKGLQDSSIVQEAAVAAGKDAILAMQKGLSGFGSVVLDSIDGSPVITPVLDLSGVQKDAGQLSKMFSNTPITVDSAYISARGAQVGYNANATALQELQLRSAEPAQQVVFNQTNNSPKALSDAEIYRQTKSLVSRAKGA